MSQLFNHKNVLILSPHPDDAEYSTSGSVFKNTHTNFHIVIISAGGDHDTTTGLSRIDECKEFWLPFQNVNVIQLFDGLFVKECKEDDIVSAIEQLNLEFDMILCPSVEDFHFEHRIVSNVARALTRKKKVSLLEYNTPSVSSGWVPNLFIDITNVFDKKKERLKCFVSQKDKHYFQSDIINSFHTDFFCNKRAYGYVEMFRSVFMFV